MKKRWKSWGALRSSFLTLPVYNFGLAEALVGWGHFGVAEQFLRAIQARFDKLC